LEARTWWFQKKERDLSNKKGEVIDGVLGKETPKKEGRVHKLQGLLS